ncbi:hypothetical protein FHG89_14430 [Micromonospora orduensis]|uniref:Uncharacterized protein n=1 Tax=Micromonospora orduensis TaxID=1420891 RepID=A0A5C4QR36_9ACTN|nr:hypothetical protein FHG89_14430 [Micromonospora orduensis]
MTGELLARWAARRPHLLVAAAPGASAARLAVEAQADRAGWPLAAAPADADVLVVAGDPGPELSAAIERVWDQFPGPRARVRVVDPADVASGLAAAVARLTGTAGERPDPGPDGAQLDGGSGRHGHGDHGGMSMPGGLMMAERAEDRDGLKLDALHLALGPVLADWPAGLVVELAVQGDVVQSASARVLPPADPAAVRPYPDVDHPGLRRRRQAVAHLDSLSRLWAVVGWPAGAATARRLRDALVDDVPLAAAYAGFRPLDRRARRSHALRRATDGLGVLSAVTAVRAGVEIPATACGDATARWRRRLAETDRLLSGGEPDTSPEPDAVAVRELAAHLMVGLDLAAARVVLASFDPDPDELVAARMRS